jgi:hypothetical protein
VKEKYIAHFVRSIFDGTTEMQMILACIQKRLLKPGAKFYISLRF